MLFQKARNAGKKEKSCNVRWKLGTDKPDHRRQDLHRSGEQEGAYWAKDIKASYYTK